MSMMLLAFAATGVAHAAPMPAPVILPRCANCSSDDDGAVATLDVEIRAGGETLWSGPMIVSSRNGASLSRMKTDAPPASCTSPGYGGGRRTSLQLNLSRNRYGSDAAKYKVHVSWEHPTTPNSCGTNDDSRSVGLTESFALDPGASIVLHGDGGLEVRVRRR